LFWQITRVSLEISGDFAGNIEETTGSFGLISRNLRTGGGYASSIAAYGGVVPVHKFCGSRVSHCVSKRHSLHTRRTKYRYYFYCFTVHFRSLNFITNVCTHIYIIKILSQAITLVALFTRTCFDPYGSSSGITAGPC